MKAIVSIYRLSYNLLIPVPAELESTFQKIPGLAAEVATASEKYHAAREPLSSPARPNPTKSELGHELINAQHELNTLTDPLCAWAAKQIEPVLGFTYLDHLNMSISVEGPEIPWPPDQEDKPSYDLHDVSSQMPSISYSGRVDALHQILSDLPPAWVYGADYTITADWVLIGPDSDSPVLL